MSAPNVIWEPNPGSQALFLQSPIFETLYAGTRGSGKAQPLDSLVLTPRGFVAMGEMRVGRQVCAPDGTVSQVIGVFPQGVTPVYRVKFKDGAETRVSPDHLWLFREQSQKSKAARQFFPSAAPAGNWRIATTEQLRLCLDRGRRLHTPLTSPTAMYNVGRSNPTPLDPYLLGLLLGDGGISYKRMVRFSTADEEIANFISELGFERLPSDARGYDFQLKKPGWLVKILRKFGLQGTRSHEKFIPKSYLATFEASRLALLQGLLDTDGSLGTKGLIEFSSSSQALAEGVLWLARSLGARATIRTRQTTHKPAHRVLIRHLDAGSLFRLSRKKERAQNYQHGVLENRIVSIAYDGSAETQCIKVSHPSGLYLTDDFIVTHNTDALLMDFAQNVGKGYGADYRGILFRQTYKQLRDVEKKALKWFPRIFPEAKYVGSQTMRWTWPDGEMLIFAYIQSKQDYLNYHGHEYPWIGFEELTNWATPDAYLAMFSCCRSTTIGMPLKVRSTTNPWGPGLNWIKSRFRLPHRLNKVVEEPELPKRIAIHGSMLENVRLLEADPDYAMKIRASAASKDQEKAWMEGSWDGASGGVFDDVWSNWHHVVRPFQVPEDWEVSRSFDWGSSRPFSVGWWAESNGSDVIYPDGSILPTVPGDLFRIDEWYGWDGTPNKGLRMLAEEVAQGILEREAVFRREGLIHPNATIYPGPADSSIWTMDNGKSVAQDMRRKGVRWVQADKSAGSRKQGIEQIRTRLKQALPPGHPAWNIPPRPPGTPREDPALFVFDICTQFVRTVPTLPRCEKDPDDINTDAEDHIADEVRYRLGWRRNIVTQRTF